MQNNAPLTDLINTEPAIFQGMTVTEAKVIGAVALVLFLGLGAALYAVLGYWQLIIVCGLFGPLLLLWIASAQLAVIKRGRPDGYYTQAIHLWLVKRGWASPHFIRHEGYWDLGRTLEFSLHAPYEFPSKDSFTEQATAISSSKTTEHEND